VVDVRPEADEAGPPQVLAPVLHPVGPKPARTYWLRRFLVLAVAIGIVVLIVQLLGRGGESEGAQTQTATSAAPLVDATASPSRTPSAETSAPSPSPAAAAAVSPTASAEPTPSAAGTPPCAPADLAVTVGTDASSYAEGDDPSVTLTVTNSSARACETNVGQNALEVRVGSGDAAVWSSDVCYPGGESDVRTLDPGAAYTTSIVWRSVASSDGCPDEPRVAPGTYHVQGRAGDVLSERVEITLS
jgi:hypothetical protein